MRFSVLAIALTMVVSPVFANDKENNQLTKITDATLSGNIHLDKISHEKDLNVKGYLQAERSNFHNLTVHGQTELEKSEVKGLLELHGQSELEECRIVGPTIAHGQCEFEQSHFEKEVSIHGATEIEDSNFCHGRYQL